MAEAKQIKFNLNDQSKSKKVFAEDKQTEQGRKDALGMTTITTKGGIRNKKTIAVLEKFVYPDVRQALVQVRF